MEKNVQLLKQDETNTKIDIKYLKQIATQGYNHIDQEEEGKKEPYLECYNNIRNELSNNIIHRELRREVNFAKAVGIAADILSQDQSEPPKEQVEQDWIDRFREAASNTTTEEIQQLWGRILAGEIKSPGKHSLRTLEFIRNLSQKEALQIEKLFSFVFDGRFVAQSFEGFYTYDGGKLNSKLFFNYLYEMQSLGIIRGADAKLWIENPPVYNEGVGIYRIRFGKFGGLYEDYFFSHENENRVLKIMICELTQLGRELYDLCCVKIDRDYLNYIVTQLEKQGFKQVPQNEIKLNFE